MNIYIITNTVNNKVYVGQTTKPLKERLRKHLYDSTYFRKNIIGNKFYRAIRKHGKDKFKISLLCSCSSLSELNKMEIEFIKNFDSVKNGYNSTYGGDCSTHTDETKAKISKANKGRVFTEDWKNKISKAKKGINTYKGWLPNAEMREKMRIASTGKILSPESKKKLSDSLKKIRNGDDNPFYGKRHSDSTKVKMSKKRNGRKPNQKFNESHMDLIKQKIELGHTLSEISKLIGMSIARVSQLKTQAGWIKLKGGNNEN